MRVRDVKMKEKKKDVVIDAQMKEEKKETEPYLNRLYWWHYLQKCYRAQ